MNTGVLNEFIPYFTAPGIYPIYSISNKNDPRLYKEISRETTSKMLVEICDYDEMKRFVYGKYNVEDLEISFNQRMSNLIC